MSKKNKDGIRVTFNPNIVWATPDQQKGVELHQELSRWLHDNFEDDLIKMDNYREFSKLFEEIAAELRHFTITLDEAKTDVTDLIDLMKHE